MVADRSFLNAARVSETEERTARRPAAWFRQEPGILADKDSTGFNFWIKNTDRAAVKISEFETGEFQEEIKLEETAEDYWTAWTARNLHGRYYLLEIERGSSRILTVDPWARAVATNSRRGLIVDLECTDPPGWQEDSNPALDSPVDAIIYEVHVRDFSSHPESGLQHRGKYLAFTERGSSNAAGLSTGLDHLVELGVTHVQLMPVFDFATVDDTDPGDYNWGYDPLYYNSPEGSYASNPADFSRITELKKLVLALHNLGIGVIMDVVYNHTYYTGKSALEKIAPGYFYRQIPEGEIANGSGVGNETASEKEKVREFIVNSVCYWAREYHLDGFRFDLMGLIDKKTMLTLKRELKKINEDILIYGEPWYALPPQLKEERLMVKGQQRGTGIAIFNDDYRNAIKGCNDGVETGFASGRSEFYREIKRGVVGQINYSDRLQGFARSPEETVNYVSCHDNLTLWDKLAKSCPHDTSRTLVSLDRMAQAIIMTSQGVPFLQGGEEFLRTKFGHNNSYRAGDEINALKWGRKTKYKDTFHYYRGLIELRKNHPAFRLQNPEDIRKYLRFLESPEGIVVFKLGPRAGGDSWKEITVIYNAWWEWVKIKLNGKKRYHVVVDDRRAGTDTIESFRRADVDAPPHSVMILYSNE